jgi:hypothetical protein
VVNSEKSILSEAKGWEIDVNLKSIGVTEISDDAFGKLSALLKEYLDKLYNPGARKSLESFLGE